MARQHLTARAADPLAVVSDICGLHAQVLSSAQLTLSARVEDAPDVSALLWRDRSLVKTWAQRGTLHLHRTDELPLWVGAQAAIKPRYEQKAWLKAFKLTPEDVQRIITGVPEALREGPKGREELAESVHPGLARGYGDLLKPVAFRGELIYAQDGRFALPEPFEPLAPEEATREVARRFLTRYGPASREELAKWFGHPSPAQAGKWFPEDVEETEFGLALAGDVEAIEAAAPAGHVRLLPAFDQYVVAAPRDDRATVAPERIYRPGGWFSPVLLVDGVMAGVWALEDGVVTIEPFAKVGKAVREAAEAEAARLPGASGVVWG
ncbi:winged helix DNA-binding domain-containing protein [Solirubrobacter phytolaccae]|uniref:Winged helix DNA-binding domain-containing protein n=1 Tax=Solirubrobacter phytolaccae TaxID=1404360 RepID=A0A9X3NBT2_9ACTN|nr:crosslink repair DNA glycosylase YcaQ family protein [Solirubrobacter phytolaccae]MDA0183538.1 winged helix DNA-binding domain-containing protein [Solirubrobacter phytolaccae]